jgi:hypothetical protein
VSRIKRVSESDVTTIYHSRVFIVTAYLIFVASAELLTTHDAKYGIVLYAFILFALLVHASVIVTTDSEFSGLLDLPSDEDRYNVHS